MSGKFFVLDLAVWCNGNSWGNWGNSSDCWDDCWGSNINSLYGSWEYCWGSSEKQLWVGISISSWSSKADSQDTGEDEYLKKNCILVIRQI